MNAPYSFEDAICSCWSAASLWKPDWIGTSAWLEHAPFGFWLIDAARPRKVVELGTHNGFSYLVFCQAVQRLGLQTACYAVDTWKGDEHAGFYSEQTFLDLSNYHNKKYSEFSQMLRMSFDRAVEYFEDKSIDLLHIDGRHGYEDVTKDFNLWRPKLSDRSIVLLHDINVRERDFGVWRFWEELKPNFPSFEFQHCHGLGVLAYGKDVPEALAPLFNASGPSATWIQTLYARLGSTVTASEQILSRDQKLAAVEKKLDQNRWDLHQARAQAELSREAAERDREAAERDRDAAVHDRDVLLASASWRMTRPVRKLLTASPRPLRLAMRRAAKLTYWMITPWRTAERIRLLVARNQREKQLSAVPNVAEPPVDTYAKWIEENDTLDDADRSAIRAHIGDLGWKPLISIAVPVYNTQEHHLREMIASVIDQLYPHWELCLADDASTEPHVKRVLHEFAALDPRIKVTTRADNGHVCLATNSALDLAAGDFVALLDHDDLLSPTALYEVVVELNANPDADIIFSDSDAIDGTGKRSLPHFKTDWDPDLLLGQNIVSHLGVYRRSLVEKIGRFRVGFEGSQDYDLTLRAAEATTSDRIRHIPAILYHWRRNDVPTTLSEVALERCLIAARRAIRDHLARKGVPARVEPAPKVPNWTRVVYLLPTEQPLVSIIIPIRDRAELTRRCVDGVLTRTDYERLEVLIVDNDSEEPETQQLLTSLAKDPRVRVLRYSGGFNYAAMNNLAVQQAQGQVVILLNNDVDVISSLWLEEMVSHALRPEVGAVGARLLYPDGSVQHAGVLLRGGGQGPSHFFLGASRDDIGHSGLLALTRRVSAVSGACIAIRRSVYLEVGGFDEVNFAVAYNDVDLCLRLGKLGYAVVWTPWAELYHLEFATRGPDTDMKRFLRLESEAEFLRQRWGSVLVSDPFYNVNCSLSSMNFECAPSRRRKPWLSQKSRTDVPRVASSRSEELLAPIDRSARIFEIGPSYNPIAPKGEGWNTSTFDHATRAELIEKYRGHPGVDVSRIEEVDFVWSGGPISDAVPSHLHGTFDAFIASHVIEHTTDLIGFLDAAATLLAPSGVMILAVPDRRFCFDYFRPLTTTGQVLEADAVHRTRHTRRIGFDHHAYAVSNSGNIAWGQTPVQELSFCHTLREAGDLFENLDENPASPYTDMHAWQFTPASFELLMLELASLGKTDWRIEKITPATGCEFHVWLRRGGRLAAATLTESKLNIKRITLLKRVLQEIRDQIDFAFGDEVSKTVSTPSSNSTDSTQTLAGFEYRAPSAQTAIDVFSGEWVSDLSKLLGVDGTGPHPVFTNDERPIAIASMFGRGGSLEGMTVLEIGPLEGGHTYALEKLGASSVIAVESNIAAWLKCLIVKETLKLPNSQFLLGDIVSYLETHKGRFDIVMCSGVLYHQADPLVLIKRIAEVTDRCFVWTHYYQPGSKIKTFKPINVAQDGLRLTYWSHDYGEPAHLGGIARNACWMQREDILNAFRHFGLDQIEVVGEDLAHPNGPSFSFGASRRPRD